MHISMQVYILKCELCVVEQAENGVTHRRGVRMILPCPHPTWCSAYTARDSVVEACHFTLKKDNDK